MGSYVRTRALISNSKPIEDGEEMRTSICCLCNGGCGIKVSLDLNWKIKAVFGDLENPYNKGKICSKPMEIAQTLYGPYRVRYPMKKVNGTFERISWDEALDVIAQKYNQYSKEYGTGSVVGITSKIGGSYSKLAHGIFSSLTGLVNYGTGPICTDSEANVRKKLFGDSSGTSPLSDVVHSKILLIVGNNAAQTKAGQFQWIMEAKRRGTRIVVVDTRFTETAQAADLFIQIRPGTDTALGMALLNYIIKNNLYDDAFVSQHTNGFEKLAQDVSAFTTEQAAEITGVPQNVIEKLAQDLATLKPGMLFEGRGVVCVNNAGASVWAFEGLMAILGNIGKRGSGIISHINNTGGISNLIEPVDVMKPDRKRSSSALYKDMEEGDVKMVIISGNPCATWPDSSRMSKALKGLDFVVSHTLVMDDSAILADIVIPATHWLEEAGVQPSVHRVLQWKNKVVETLGEEKSGGDFYRLLAERMGLNSSYFPDSPEAAWELERKYNKNVSGISRERMLTTPGGVHFPSSEIGKETVRLFQNGVFKTSSGKVELTGVSNGPLEYVDTFEAPGNDGVSREEFPYLFSTNKVARHYHTECQYSVWAKEMEEPYVEIHPLTALEIGVAEGDKVRVETLSGSIVLAAKITQSVQRGFLSTQPYFGLQSPYGQAPANTLFPVAADPVGGNLISKNIQCKAKAEGGQGL
ncbi:anaerobic dehydrogenase, typically selenocysteine-containing [Desulfosporosinus orientis DSM 765]|uniref:Anaerobic dehydrogenase, typically selenocysteine-containing n=1 Tax=Desulfosporosinus orientis (strain ATCC 19365 / DSM 765 / NCIMB 8382 / VKM B-1628 / Singapore I) TaxID=768706 RepID=G7W4Y9_DESOD|nr:molybdopterin-dependent oxidoreductase [Desulfosporosinus orientis]AET65861.1 anaerobic dehydrogenase, typically selenocysteine-containing [Desulfosporosinus orientis DSM 765]